PDWGVQDCLPPETGRSESRGVVTVYRVGTGLGRHAPDGRSPRGVWDKKRPEQGKVKGLANRGTTAFRRAQSSPAPRRLSVCFFDFQSLPPLGGFVRLTPGVVELHHAIQGLSQPGLVLLGNFGLPVFHAVVALQQERLGIYIPLLAQERATEQGLGVKCR